MQHLQQLCSLQLGCTVPWDLVAALTALTYFRASSVFDPKHREEQPYVLSTLAPSQVLSHPNLQEIHLPHQYGLLPSQLRGLRALTAFTVDYLCYQPEMPAVTARPEGSGAAGRAALVRSARAKTVVWGAVEQLTGLTSLTCDCITQLPSGEPHNTVGLVQLHVNGDVRGVDPLLPPELLAPLLPPELLARMPVLTDLGADVAVPGGSTSAAAL